MKRQEGNVAPFTNEAKPALFFLQHGLNKGFDRRSDGIQKVQEKIRAI